jgi:hypothetical protein
MTIWGRYKGGDAEKIDTCSKSEASSMLGEYRMAFGSDWKLWAGRKKDEPSE